MRKLIVFLLFFSLFFISFNNNAQAQWENTQVQRLTCDDLPNKVIRLYIDETDKLYLFYLEGVRDTITGFVYYYRILYRTKEKGSAWSLSVEIQTPIYIFGQNRKGGLWMDSKTKIIHILYSTFAGDVYDDTLYYTNSNIPNWEFTKIDSLPGQQWHADYSSFDMEFDSMGNAHVVWHLNFDSLGQNWCRIIYANNSTGKWIKQPVSLPIWLGSFGTTVSDLSVQKNGTAHILYQGEAYCDTECVVFYVRNDSLNVLFPSI